MDIAESDGPSPFAGGEDSGGEGDRIRDPHNEGSRFCRRGVITWACPSRAHFLITGSIPPAPQGVFGGGIKASLLLELHLQRLRQALDSDGASFCLRGRLGGDGDRGLPHGPPGGEQGTTSCGTRGGVAVVECGEGGLGDTSPEFA